VDLAVPFDTEIRASGAGIVRRASEDDVNGRVVILDHGRGVTTAYCHNSALLVAVGDRVERGQVIARSGSTGRSTGPHLHYQLELGHEAVDPLRFRTLVEPRVEKSSRKKSSVKSASAQVPATPPVNATEF
jgi:murein DD-endopeptidase MepM/ murein hydrolase activator NlpD